MFQLLAIKQAPNKEVVSWGVPGRLDMSGKRVVPSCMLTSSCAGCRMSLAFLRVGSARGDRNPCCAVACRIPYVLPSGSWAAQQPRDGRAGLSRMVQGEHGCNGPLLSVNGAIVCVCMFVCVIVCV